MPCFWNNSGSALPGASIPKACRQTSLVALLLLLLLLLLSCWSCRSKEKEPPMTREEYSQRKQQLMEVNKILVKKDQQRIRGYVERNGLEMTETETGLWFHIETTGDGPKCETDDRVSLRYRISLLDGTECYNSDTDGLKEFQIGRGGVESGLEEGILLLNEGSIATFIMPPYLAHGLPGDGERIPARAILIYYVEVLAVDKSRYKLN